MNKQYFPAIIILIPLRSPVFLVWPFSSKLPRFENFSVIEDSNSLSLLKVKKWSAITQSCQTLWYPMDCNLPSSSVHGILQARILECLFQGIFLTQVLSLGLLHFRRLSLPSEPPGKFSLNFIEASNFVYLIIPFNSQSYFQDQFPIISLDLWNIAWNHSHNHSLFFFICHLQLHENFHHTINKQNLYLDVSQLSFFWSWL